MPVYFSLFPQRLPSPFPQLSQSPVVCVSLLLQLQDDPLFGSMQMQPIAWNPLQDSIPFVHLRLRQTPRQMRQIASHVLRQPLLPKPIVQPTKLRLLPQKAPVGVWA